MSVLKTYGAKAEGWKPSRTYRLENGRIEGMVDGREAVRQAVLLILSVERFAHLIYSWDYGVELEELVGRPRPYVQADLRRRIEEALAQDDRVTGVEGFSITFDREAAGVSLKVKTVFGDFPVERRIPVGSY